MSREIKYRAWDLDRKEFLSAGAIYIEILAGRAPKSCPTYLDMVDNRPDFYQNRFVLQQFTGLTDRGGKPIFEGDIVLFMGRPRVIRFNDLPPCFTIDPSPSNVKSYPIWEPGQMEILGNVHENPGLMEGTADAP